MSYYDVIQDSCQKEDLFFCLPSAEGRLILLCTLEICVAVPGSFKMCFALLLGSLILGYYGKVAIGTLWFCTTHDYESNNYWCLIAGQLTLSPMTVAPVCSVGDPLQLICTASIQFIRWSIVVINEQGMEEEITVSRNSRDLSPPPRERVINSTKFTFLRVSGEDELPLVSTLAINSTGIGLNGTVVRCRDAENTGTMISISTTIKIISNSKLATSIQNYLSQ